MGDVAAPWSMFQVVAPDIAALHWTRLCGDRDAGDRECWMAALRRTQRSKGLSTTQVQCRKTAAEMVRGRDALDVTSQVDRVAASDPWTLGTSGM
jgi:hypothetical protein